MPTGLSPTPQWFTPSSCVPQFLTFIRTVRDAPRLDSIHFRRTNAYVLCIVIIGLSLVAIGVNWRENTTRIIPALAATAAVAACSLLWLYKKKDQAMQPLFCSTGAMCLLGVYLLTVQGAPDNSSLFWFVMFPPLVMFSMGLRHGTVMFLGFFTFITLLLFSPLDRLLHSPLAESSRIRLVLAMLGAFGFSWAAEYVRFNTRQTLTQTLARMEKEALTDMLTGLGNRRDFQNVLAWAMAKAGREGTPFSLAMIDLDFFKQVNDRYGHVVGDRMLRHVAKTLDAEKRATDFLFRWGGEEFILLMPDLEAEQAGLVAERLRKRVRQSPFVEGDLVIPHTVSIGLYSGREKQNPHAPVIQADRNLYRAKTAGRDCVMSAQADS